MLDFFFFASFLGFSLGFTFDILTGLLLKNCWGGGFYWFVFPFWFGFFLLFFDVYVS